MDDELLACMRRAMKLAKELGEPIFYLEKRAEWELSKRLFARDPLVRRALVAIGEEAESLGHGLFHVKRVAVDAGAIVIVEGAGRRAVRLAHLAGVLHDLKRGEPDHAKKGAEAAGRLLTDWGLSEEESRAVAFAIGNHEAFRVPVSTTDSFFQLLSDSLYDADKFRWGPDNFTETVWRMMAHYGISLKEALPRLEQGLEGIARIRDTFRTATGRRYGPDFIDRGLALGWRLFEEMRERFA